MADVLTAIAERKRADLGQRLAARSYDPQPTRRSLRTAMQLPGARFIMEVKKASPSGHRSAIAVETAASAYATQADAISVLTDTPFFGGALEDLQAVRQRFDGPILAKDFIIDPLQVTEARTYGADAVLVILALLGDDEAASVMAEARRLRMDVITEVHDEKELRRALSLGAAIIGVNNRDLRTLQTDLHVTRRLSALVPKDRILISESGIADRGDVEQRASRVDGFLVGSSLMASPNIAEAAKALVRGRIKICGITRPRDAALAAWGATHVGLIFAEGSARQVSSNAASIVDTARRGGAKPVGVFQNQDPAFVARTAAELGLAAIQLHGSERGLERLRDRLPETCEIWAACRVGPSVEPERRGADRILYDTLLDGRSGGTGRAFDWSLLGGRAHLPSAFIAGGIGPRNARRAQSLAPFGIDVGSAVEDGPGRKDTDQLARLFEAVRPPCRRTL